MDDQILKERLPDAPERAPRLSYKFQRLRERLREAIETGVLSGKLPGERVLARQFRVNAKTLSKALTDLAAEGLLERTIGRGTFVRGQGPADEAPSLGRWLILAGQGRDDDPIVELLREVNADCAVVTQLGELRPSFLTGFASVIDLHGVLPETMLRDFMLRSLKVVLVDTLPRTYSTHAVIIDRALCAGRLTQMLLGKGHRRLGVLAPPEQLEAFDAVRDAAQRLAPDANVQSVELESLTGAVEAGMSGLIVDGFRLAQEAVTSLRRHGIDVPARLSVGAIGIDTGGTPRVSGFVVKPDQLVDSIKLLLRDASNHKPTPLWLVGALADHGTLQSPPATNGHVSKH